MILYETRRGQVYSCRRRVTMIGNDSAFRDVCAGNIPSTSRIPQAIKTESLEIISSCQPVDDTASKYHYYGRKSWLSVNLTAKADPDRSTASSSDHGFAAASLRQGTIWRLELPPDKLPRTGMDAMSGMT